MRTATSCAGKFVIFMNFFHAVNIAIKQQQYCNTVRLQLSSDRFTQHMTSQTWRLKRLLLKPSSHISAMVGDDIRIIAGNKLFVFCDLIADDRRYNSHAFSYIANQSPTSQSPHRRPGLNEIVQPQTAIFWLFKVLMKRKLSLFYLKETQNDKVTSFVVFGFLASFLRYFSLFDMEIKHIYVTVSHCA